MEIESQNCLTHLLGFNETELLNKLESNQKINIPGSGTFETLTIHQLKEFYNENYELINKLNNDNLPIFTIYVRKKYNSDNSFFDTSLLQVSMSKKSNKKLMFQVASNFDCQERPSSMTNLFDGHHLTNLMTDRTQGPSASGGAFPGAVLRYCQEYHHHVDLLESTPLKTVNGKLINYSDFDIDTVKVGIQSDVSPYFERNGNVCKYHSDVKPIDQVFTSTICLNNRNEIFNNEIKKNCMEKLLEAAYVSTFLAAAKNNTQILILTLIGGGVFYNPLTSIINAMIEQLIKYPGNLQEVILPLFDPNINHTIIINKLNSIKYPKNKINVVYK